jgi:NADH-quinone oxidoreductase subunit G
VGPAGRRSSGRPTSTPSSATASTRRSSACPRATIDQAAAATTIILLGPDLKEELPVLYLRVRDAAEKRRTRILELSPRATGLTPYAWRSVRYEPGGRRTWRRSTLAEAEVAEQLGRGPSW